MEKIGLIAGNGSFPLIFAREARARGLRVVATAHRGETDEAIEDLVDEIVWIRVGQLGRMIEAFKRAGVERAVMAGGIDKASSLLSLRPDWRGMQLLRRAVGMGDDALLRGLADELARDGIEIVPSTLFLERLVARRGRLAGPRLDAGAREDVRLGCRVLEAVGSLDVGQGVVVENGVVLAIEAIEGTDAAIRRGAGLGRGRAVVVKAAKRGQDLRFDVPAVGPSTIEVMAEAGAKTLAVEADVAIILEKESVVDLARRHRISVVGCTASGEIDER
jgi:DUF1009 family protein